MFNTFRGLFRAEWQKIVSNRLSTFLLVLIFPIGALVITILFVLGELLSPDFRQTAAFYPPRWSDTALSAWAIPNSEIGRLMMLAFTAIVFAGEYQSGTWKNLLTRRRRTTLILIKFFTIGVFVVLSFVVMTIIAGLGAVLIDVVAGAPVPGLDGEALPQFFQTYAAQALLTLLVTLIAAEYTALAGVITRSVLGSTVVGVVVTLGETASLIALLLLAQLFKRPSFVHLYQFTPEYNLANLGSWFTKQIGYTLSVGPYSFDPLRLAASVVILAVWVVGLLGLTLYIFRRQDITN